MRSRLGTKSRLAAHITALVLLVLVLVYMPMSPAPTDNPEHESIPGIADIAEDTVASKPVGGQAAPATKTPEIASEPTVRTKEVAVAPTERVKPEIVAPPATGSRTLPGDTSEPAPSPAVLPGEAVRATDGSLRPADGKASVRPSEASPAVKTDTSPLPTAAVATQPDAGASAKVGETAALSTDGAVTDTKAADAPSDKNASVAPAVEDKSGAAAVSTPDADTGTMVDGDGAGDKSGSANPDAGTDAPAVVQPDESGSLVVASPTDSDIIEPVKPFAGANLEVLGDNVYWLDPQHDLEKELAAVPDIGTLVLLAPMPAYWLTGFEHVKSEVIPADLTDLSEDAAAHFLHLTADAKRPVVAAALPGARGAAFFKGVYLLAKRNLDPADLETEIDSELKEAGDAADEILHRLRRLDVKRLR